MSNDYFQFKQFRIDQAHCAMKVTTDACIQGAWTPVHSKVKQVLDIGAGTGLLSLMLAQRNADIAIDAIEYDSDAAMQAAQNVAASPWKHRLAIIEGDVREQVFTKKYDLIISNPPFFINSLQNTQAKKTAARHNLTLSLSELLAVIKDNLNEDGYASILLPIAEYGIWTNLAEQQGLYEYDKLLIKHTPTALVKRVVGLFCAKRTTDFRKQTLIIKDDANNYTGDFNALLRPYYLHL